MSRFDAAIFDLDGLLIDSEPFWRVAEIAVFADVGVAVTDAECDLTTGLRTERVVDYWLERRPWDIENHPKEVVTQRINDRVVELIRERGEPMIGVDHALSFMKGRGLRLALASSSSVRIIDAALDRLGIADAFEVVHSADLEKLSKPAPDVYLGAARRLGVEPGRCVALEDSIPGTQSAKAAGMACIRFPEHDRLTSNADLELGSLLEIDAKVWDRLSKVPVTATE